MHYQVFGPDDAPCVLLAHGWGQQGSNLQTLAECLARDYRVIVPDLPGFGRSERPPSAWGVEEYAAAIVQLLDTLSISQVMYIGHSFGGKIGLQLAAKYGDRVQSLVLISSAGLRPHQTLPSTLRRLLLRFGAKGIKAWDRFTGSDLFPNWYTPRYGSRDYRNAGAMRPILVRSVNEDVSQLLPLVSQPVLLLWGADDGDTPPEMAQRFCKLLPQATLHLFPDKGHHLCNGVGAHLCMRYLTPFLQASSEGCRV